jgi:hypothetical protein
MKFRTEIEVNPFSFALNHQSKVLLMGSCFTTNMGEKLTYSGFETLNNPFGITFNPSSVATQVTQILEGRTYVENDLKNHDAKYLSFEHHSSFNHSSAEKVLEAINTNINEASKLLTTAEVLFISLGSAWVWESKESGQIVNNCHKIPVSEFNKKLLSYEEILSSLNTILTALNEYASQLNVVFTISPVRHWRHGAIENMHSKSVLHAATQSVVQDNVQAHYFPSYEIMMDDLRDYRFYTDDLLHPSQQAIEYIWEKFGDAFFSNKTKLANGLVSKIRMMQNHRNVSGSKVEIEKFNLNLEKRIQELKSVYGIELK